MRVFRESHKRQVLVPHTSLPLALFGVTCSIPEYCSCAQSTGVDTGVSVPITCSVLYRRQTFSCLPHKTPNRRVTRKVLYTLVCIYPDSLLIADERTVTCFAVHEVWFTRMLLVAFRISATSASFFTMLDCCAELYLL